MKISSTFLIPALLCGMSLPAAAQRVTVSPVPQAVTWGEKAFDKPSSVKLNGSDRADADAVALLNRHFDTTGKGKAVKITIGERGDKAVAKYAGKIPAKPDGYYLNVTPKEVVIAGNDEKGTFYGVQTFLQLASQPEVMSVEITDWPATANRGVVEGFYGNPWSLADRLHQFDFYGANKLDTYIYGPKDDPYHHSRWREPYPEDRAAVMRQMADAAARNKVWFVWAMHPGNAIESDSDRQAALDKFERMYDMGFRSFGIFFDDISNYDAAKQADYLNFLTDNFIRKHSDVTPLVMCPSEYNKGWAGDGSYLRTLGELTYPEVRIMWTGNSVVDMIEMDDLEWVEPLIKRTPFIWLNWPVNDYCVNHLLMGRLYGNGTDIADHVSGFTLNPMEYAEASLVSLYQGADYLWNPTSYSPDSSWIRAIDYCAPTGLQDELLTFCDYNVDLGANGHRLRRFEESPRMKRLAADYNASSGATRAKWADSLRAEFDRVSMAARRLSATADTNALTKEVKPWIDAMELLGSRGNLALDLADAYAKGDSVGFIDTYLWYKALTESASRIESRNFPGSIKVAYPVVGTLYTEPFIRNLVADLTNDYRANYGYRADVIPVPVVENGNYHIIVDGRYLGNPQAGGVGGAPVLEAAEDVVNPDRQLWRIVLNPVTERYEIINAKDRRYLNEGASFARNPETNPFDPDWHTFVIERDGDRFAIRTGGVAERGGRNYWVVDGDRLTPRRIPADEPVPYIFRLESSASH